MAMRISVGPALTDAEAADLRERFRAAGWKGAEVTTLPTGSNVCYSRGMTNEMVEILKAKRDAVQSLAAALDYAVNQSGTVGDSKSAVAFTNTWLEALDSMVPTDED
jgi:hypothetical protein